MIQRATGRFALSFLTWIAVGLLVGLDALLFISFFPALLLTAPVTYGVALGIEQLAPSVPGRWGIAVGASALPFFFAFSNTPGQSDPQVWAALGIGLVLTGLVGALRAGRRACRSGGGRPALS